MTLGIVPREMGAVGSRSTSGSAALQDFCGSGSSVRQSGRRGRERAWPEGTFWSPVSLVKTARRENRAGEDDVVPSEIGSSPIAESSTMRSSSIVM